MSGAVGTVIHRERKTLPSKQKKDGQFISAQ